MNRRMKRRYQFLFWAASLFIAACATGTLNVSRTVSPKSLGAIAVLPFEGHGGDLFSDLVANEFLRRNVTLVERARLFAILNERNLQLKDMVGGKIDPTGLAKVLGIDTLVFPTFRTLRSRFLCFSRQP